MGHKDRSNKKETWEPGSELKDKGDVGEEVVGKYLKTEYDEVYHIADEHKKKDFECWEFKKTEIEKTIVEAKCEFKIYNHGEYGNITWELCRIRKGGEVIVPGWGWETKSDFVIYFIPQTEEILIADVEEVRRAIWESWQSGNQSEYMRPEGTPTNKNKVTIFFLVPVSALERGSKIQKKDVSDLIDRKTVRRIKEIETQYK
ncbi:hypothetical protein AKJ37_03180 [candidate division MSBL1 archaeon SCGC-AAA259I09]|uniref:Uncharacterized protein n=1 Tax=candidate division MSBL1 archaeon SCGC-AAA259I09 TaxID=1698267 RepID=A0A133UT93_9EURY|nr:hypothetical protein AKJ37_03180 [candidate division MSBL1 archaeon SCGC-AAA259I09]